VSDALTFAMVALSAPNDVRSDTIAETCAEVKAAADAIGANESIDIANASPVATVTAFALMFINNC
jgi:hypothetical protein